MYAFVEIFVCTVGIGSLVTRKIPDIAHGDKRQIVHLSNIYRQNTYLRAIFFI